MPEAHSGVAYPATLHTTTWTAWEGRLKESNTVIPRRLWKICITPKTQDIVNQLLKFLILNAFIFLYHYFFILSNGYHYTLCLIQYLGYSKCELFKMSPAAPTKASQALEPRWTAEKARKTPLGRLPYNRVPTSPPRVRARPLEAHSQFRKNYTAPTCPEIASKRCTISGSSLVV